MNKKIFLTLFLLILLIAGIKFERDLQKEIFYITEPVKGFYNDIRLGLKNRIEKYFNQAETISKLKKENIELEKYFLKYNSLKNDFDSLKKECNVSLNIKTKLKLVRAIAYNRLNDFSSLWVDFKDFNKSKIYGIIKDGFAAGIIVSKDSKPLALLNSSSKCAYAVDIGKDRAPGIATGQDDKTMVVKFIPMYKNVKIGDEVITSGLDNIFFYGVKVGKVLKVEKRGGYKIAIIKPYADILNPRYFWVASQKFN